MSEDCNMVLMRGQGGLVAVMGLLMVLWASAGEITFSIQYLILQYAEAPDNVSLTWRNSGQLHVWPSSLDGLAVMSVDFGSEFMKVAIVKPGVPMEIVLNPESKRKTPVVVSMRDGERLFGDPAVNTAIRFPKLAYRFIRDLIGKPIDSPQVQLFLRRFPYHTVEEDPDTKTLVFRHDEETSYTPEELMAMMLEQARHIAENFAEQPVSDAVIAVPPYWNQAERRAMLRAADLAGVKVLQLMNENTAVAFNYGIFRRKSFNSTAVSYMFFDMGASSTTATVVSYQLVKAKNAATGIAETNPQLTIKAVGYDNSLGGLEFQLRLREHLAKLFNAQKLTPSDVHDNPRAMGKLLKEAGRVMQVLSANTQHMAQVEGLLDDKDFKAKVTRAEFEELCSDLFTRIKKPVEDAMKLSEFTWDEITEVILMGGATRIPKVQDMLRATIGREELGMGINTDEAGALGAVYQAAHLSKGFKVKPFIIKDTTLFPIQVEFERVRQQEDTAEASKTVKRTLFGLLNPYPQKKVMTFNKHVKDFQFNVNYGDLSHLSDEQQSHLGVVSLLKYSLTGVEEAYGKHASEADPKGVKAHFRMDDSGILTLEKSEFIFERSAAAEGADTDSQSTLSKIGSYLFGGSEEKEGEVEEGTPQEGSPGKEEGNQEPATKPEAPAADAKATEKAEEEVPAEEETKQDVPPETEDTPKEETKEDKKADETKKDESSDKKETEKTENKDPEKTEEKKLKPAIIKEPLTSDRVLVDLTEPAAEKITASKNKIAELKLKDKEKHALEKAKNDLETFIVDTQDKLWQDIYEKSSSEEQRENLRTMLSEAYDWLYEVEEDAPRKVFEDKLKEIKKPFKGLFSRVREHSERPTALAALNSVMNYSQVFFAGMKNLTGEEMPFTPVEYETLKKLIQETQEWNATVLAEQAEKPLTDNPAMTLEDIGKKIYDLEREVKYLLNKLKIYKPKPKPKADNETTKLNATKIKTGKVWTADSEDSKPDPEENAAQDSDDAQPPPSQEAEEEEEETLQLPETDSQEDSSTDELPSKDEDAASEDHQKPHPLDDEL